MLHWRTMAATSARAIAQRGVGGILHFGAHHIGCSIAAPQLISIGWRAVACSALCLRCRARGSHIAQRAPDSSPCSIGGLNSLPLACMQGALFAASTYAARFQFAGLPPARLAASAHCHRLVWCALRFHCRQFDWYSQLMLENGQHGFA